MIQGLLKFGKNMLKDSKDKIKLEELMDSLYKWSMKSMYYSILHTEYEKDTGTLYRFGWFFINDEKYAVVSWQFSKGFVTFEHDKTHEKIKFNINESEFIKDIKTPSIYFRFKRRILNRVSKLLKELSDKLQS